jgi:oligopeptide transport system permease protein
MAEGAPATAAELEHYERLLKEADAIRGVSLGQDAWRRLRRKPTAMLSLSFLMLLSLLALFTPLLPLQSPRIIHPTAERQFQPPELTRAALALRDSSGSLDARKVDEAFGSLNTFNRALVWLRGAAFGDFAMPSLCGTDELGRDVLARLFWGARVSLIVGLVATLVALVIGVSYGAISGYLGGWVDNVMMRIVDVMYSIPFIFVVIFVITILSAEEIRAWMLEHGIDRITVFYLVVGAIYWLTMARVVRGQVISLKNDQFVEAAKTIGAGRPRIIFRHLVPNLFSIIIVYLTLTIPQVMLFEAFLSFLGLGVEPPDVSWGLLANEGVMVITPVKIYWWLVLFPGLALGLTLFSLNFLGDGLRDALDPRLKNSGR